MSLPPLLGRGWTVERPPGDPNRPPQGSVPVAGLVSVLCVLTGLALIVVGVWNAAAAVTGQPGWPWGLIALGAALLAIDRWPEGGGPG